MAKRTVIQPMELPRSRQSQRVDTRVNRPKSVPVPSSVPAPTGTSAGEIASLGSAVSGGFRIAQQISQNAEQRQQDIEKKEALQRQQDAFKGAFNVVNSYRQNYINRVMNGDVPEDAQLFEWGATAAISNYLGTDDGAMLSNQQRNFLMDVINKQTTALAGQGTVKIDSTDGKAFVYKDGIYGSSLDIVSAEHDPMDIMQAEMQEDFPYLTAQLERRLEDNPNDPDVQDSIARTVDKLVDANAELELLNFRGEFAKARKDLNQGNETKNKNTVVQGGAIILENIANKHWEFTKNPNFDGDYLALANGFEQSAQKALSTKLAKLANTYGVDVTDIRTQYQELIDTQVEIFKGLDPSSIAKRDADTARNRLVRKAAENKMRLERIKGNLSPSTAFIMDDPSGLYYVSMLGQITGQGNRNLNEVSRALQLSQTRFQDLSEEINTRMTPEAAGTQEGTLAALEIIEPVSEAVEAWSEGRYLDAADARGLSLIMEQLKANPVVQSQDVKPTFKRLIERWEAVKNMPKHEPVFRNIENFDSEQYREQIFDELEDGGFFSPGGNKGNALFPNF